MKKYRDEIAEVCHEIVKDGYRSGIVTDDEMREFEADSFVSEPKPLHTVPSPAVIGSFANGNTGGDGTSPIF
jgi:hypothetical protein